MTKFKPCRLLTVRVSAPSVDVETIGKQSNIDFGQRLCSFQA